MKRIARRDNKQQKTHLLIMNGRKFKLMVFFNLVFIWLHSVLYATSCWRVFSLSFRVFYLKAVANYFKWLKAFNWHLVTSSVTSDIHLFTSFSTLFDELVKIQLHFVIFHIIHLCNYDVTLVKVLRYQSMVLINVIGYERHQFERKMNFCLRFRAAKAIKFSIFKW